MGSRIDHYSHYAFPVATVHAALVDENYWRSRLAEIGGPGATLEDVRTGDGTIDLHMTQSIPAEHLPSFVTNFHPGDLVIHRHESWQPVTGDRATGRFSAHVDGLPGKVDGTSTMAPDGAGTIVEIDGEAEVRIPFLGGKIEGIIVEQIVELFDVERTFTAKWLSEPH
ncbi:MULTISPECIES: DUF2505 domain-containing protein [Rhodococcus]|jgi:hypothetical protein|uniref:DUF2505 domain-containing protein n=1 Tax=Rhodococcus aetherivorans TaxID=191292 RepID=A0A059MM36_9NOCA|nr:MULTISPECIES: DUF2505 domain-containing protein [Rhodococcus]ETT23259.1 Protein of unknown function DUF2505 [Rhodococcus rhodochrous ATCC 21198]NCL73887.1 hypothetical protein [Rhodococcus sp. YH1]AKE91067.1 hypothetical protein AAT18_19495 [Rhodococcus aetherivorans]ANZ24161.1 hypothetical protein A4U64_05220 [Rhodococcus sp. WB1]KDE11976.1 hypothetical protein N505_0116905 [Rhodococcus aetherivorans]